MIMNETLHHSEQLNITTAAEFQFFLTHQVDIYQQQIDIVNPHWCACFTLRSEKNNHGSKLAHTWIGVSHAKCYTICYVALQYAK